MNPNELRQRDLAQRFFRAALNAADPDAAIRHHVRIEGDTLIAGPRRYDRRRFRRVWVVGSGKASARMAQLFDTWDNLAGGLINTKTGHLAPLTHIRLNECSHPKPDASGVRGAQEIAAIAEQAGPDDLVVALISGGASALLPLPAAGITLADKQATTQLLLDSGADIGEMNTVRKHLSAVKGGQLARLAAPATLITLVLSDVVGDPLDVIGSGPTVPDLSTFAQAKQVLVRRGIWDLSPPAVRERLQAGVDGLLPETPKPGDPAFANTQNLVVGSNRQAVAAAAEAAQEAGYRVLVLSTLIEGETREIARMHGAILREVVASGQPVSAPACLISGGETTVTIRGPGKGGRNQEFALAAAMEIAGLPDVTVLSAGTDGSDGPTDATGAIVSGGTLDRASALGLDAARSLAQNDAYPFFDALGDLLRTGPTHTNVMDIRVMLVGLPS